MARMQILELPEGAGDERPPFVLVIDQAPRDETSSAFRDDLDNNRIAAGIGARHVLVFEDTIDIPANEVPVDPDGYPVRVHVEGDFEQFREQAEQEIRAAQRKATATLGRSAIVDHERKTSLLDALGMDRTRDWDDIRNTAAGLQKRCEELRAESLRRGKIKGEYAEHIRQLEAQLEEARTWARHGYEIGQRHCGWTDHGVAPAWLTEGWPPSVGTCEHLQEAAEYDEALTRVRNLPEQPEAMDAQHSDPSAYLHGYKVAIRDAKRAVRSFQATGPTDG